ncbi:hypothetical protein [Collimonas silvisoli]|uniref:hypothetical protein n=1 Tax=Collimonas silvisoli TaxID=2825884 RepID=UPI001B8C02DC|nr:hypothetical protein [Collimonas silvisoli]
MKYSARTDDAEVRAWVARLADESRAARAMLTDYGIEVPPDRRVRMIESNPGANHRDDLQADWGQVGMSE